MASGEMSPGEFTAFLRPFMACGLPLKQFHQANENFQKQTQHGHLIVLPVLLVWTDQTAVSKAMKPVATAA